MKLFVIDAGNAYIKMEVFEGEKTAGFWQLETSKDLNEEKIISEIERNFSEFGISKHKFRGVVFGCVVPEVTQLIQNALSKTIKSKHLINVTSQTKTGLYIPSDNKRIGADRIADMVGAAKIYGAPLVVVSLGTATVFTVLGQDMNVLGGQIVAGGDLALHALLRRSSNISNILTLPPEITDKVKIIPTNIIIGRNTEENIMAGSFWGLASQVEGISTLIKKELMQKDIISGDIKIIVTGGLSNIFKDFRFSNVDYIDPHLTRKGLRIIGEMNFM